MGGWSDKTKLILISNSVEVVVEVELGKNLTFMGFDTNGISLIILYSFK